jgi:pimeloyl-ACP methyl ester carboxylesterase
MNMPAYFPFHSAAVRDSYFEYYDSVAAKEWPIASEERMVPTSYGQTFVRISGPAGAPPLVLLPGAVSTSLMWTPNIRALSEAYRTFAVDQVGDVGRSTCTQPVRRLEDLLAWLDEFLDALGLRNRVNLMGCSYGGWLTAEYARHAPQRLSTVVLLAPGGAVHRLSSRFMIGLTLAALAPRWFLGPLLRWMFADMVRKDPAWVDRIVEELRISMRSVQRRLPFSPVWTDAEWGAMGVPALFLVGEHETIYDARKAVRRLERVAPRVTAEIIPGAGHDLTIVQAEMVNQRILEFLNQKAVVPEASMAGAR